MNPAILGALIGAVPGTIAAALTTWVSIRTAGQAQIRERSQWVRDRRAAVYEELISTVLEMSDRRAEALALGQPVDAALQAADTYIEREDHSNEAYRALISRMIAYASPTVWGAYYDAVTAETEVWRVTKKEMAHTNAATVVASSKLAATIINAKNQSKKFWDTAHQDLQTL
jgi:hypothetical protein